MSNILKSKTFIVGGLVIAVAMMLSVIAVSSALAETTTTSSSSSSTTTTVTASAYNYSGVMKVGSKGPGVSTLQAALNSVQTTPQIVVDGSFGPATKSAVVAFQASHGLVADGVVGPMTGAKLAAATVAVITIPGGFPAGCMSASGFSTTTGQSCATSTSLPAGCTSSSGFSPTTGIKCDSSGGGSTGGPLSGGAGDIDLTAKSTYSNEDVVAGEEDVPVLAFEVEADDGSDVEITNVKVEFINSNGASSDSLDDYAESISIWMGDEMVGESDADEFSENSNFWSDTIALSGAVVEAGDTETFSVAVTALNNLDSGDIDTDSWSVDLLSVRFKDAAGVTTTETANASGTDAAAGFQRDLDFDDLATSGDLELKASLGSNSPDAGSVEVDTTTTTDVTMLEFTLKAEGSDMNIDSLELTGAIAGNATNTWADMISELTLEADGDEIDSVSAYGTCADGSATTDDTGGDICFTDLDLDIEEDDTVTFKAIAKVRAIAADFDEGDSFTVSFPAASLDDTTNTDVEDGNGDTVVAGDRTGSAVGETQTFYSSGVMVDMGNVTYESITDSGNVTQVTYNIPLSVTAFGDTRYVGLAAQYEATHTTITDDLALSFALQDSTAPTTDLENGTVSSTWTCDASIEGGIGYRLDEGDEVDCTLQVIHTTPGTASRSYRVHVEGFQSYLDAALTNDATNELIQLLSPADEFQTDYKFIFG
jgi:hypothetical protein